MPTPACEILFVATHIRKAFAWLQGFMQRLAETSTLNSEKVPGLVASRFSSLALRTSPRRMLERRRLPKFLCGRFAWFVLAVFLGIFTPPKSINATTATETVLHSFCTATGCLDGETPLAGLVQAADGNYYGTTLAGGANNFGTIFRMTPNGTLTTIYSFTGDSDGGFPTGLVQGDDGDLYGLTVDSSGNSASGYGRIFKITLAGELTILNSLKSGYVNYPNDLRGAGSGLILGNDGNFYGTTLTGGTDYYGTVFRMTPGGDLSTIYTFSGGSDGSHPGSSLVQGTDGNFYSTTQEGGTHAAGGDGGTVFSITPSGKLTTLYSFCTSSQCPDGSNPYGGLVQGPDGNFYGSTAYGGGTHGGVSGGGTIFKITPTGTLTTLIDGFFCVQLGCSPQDTLTLGSDGNFYSTFGAGGPVSYPERGGTAFQVTPSGAFTLLYAFCGLADCEDGQLPYGGLIQGSDGKFYGTASSRSVLNGYQTGVVYQLAPASGMAAPVQLSLSASNVALSTPVTLNWKVLNAFSMTMQQCYAFVQNNATGAGTWTGLQTGTLSNGVYSGSATITPTANGTYTYVLTCGGIESGFATLAVAPLQPLTIVSTTVPNGKVGADYLQTLEASGGAAPYSWNMVSGALPAGLSIAASTGTISGIPTQAGTTNFVVQVQDAESIPKAATANLTILIAKTAPTVTVTPTTYSITTAQVLAVTVVVAGTPTPTGTVTLSGGGFTSAAATLNGGSASVNIPAGSLAVGSVTLTASYTPDITGSSTYNSATETSLAVTVTQAKTTPTVTVTPALSSITTQQDLTVTVIVNGGTGNPTPTGSVNLTSGSYGIFPVTLINGSATIIVYQGNLTPGSHTLTSTYTPDSTSSSIYDTATGTSSAVTVTQAKTSPPVTVIPASFNLTTAQSLPVTVTVAGTPTPTGSVVLSSGSYTSAATALTSGSAVITIPAGALAVGSDTLTASYTPDTNSSSTYNSTAATTVVTVTQAKTSPPVTVMPSSSSVTTAQPLTVTVAVNGGTGHPMPTGSVTLSSGSYSSAATALTSGSTVITIPAGALAAGSDTLTAIYTPDSNSSSTYSSSTATTVVTVTQAKTTPTVTVIPATYSITMVQTLSVTVAVNATSGSPTPTGTVILSGGGFTSAATLNGGSASINIPAGSLAKGSVTLTASYTPDTTSSSNYNSATGTSLAVTVTQAKTTPTVTVIPTTYSITTAQALAVTVMVNATSGSPTPTGTVILSGGGFTSAATTLNGGSAGINIPAGSLAKGSVTLTASYTPDTTSSSTYDSATGTSSVVTVAQAKTTPTVTVTPTSNSITMAQALAVTVVVNATSGNQTPTGSVTLTSGTYSSAATTLSGGSATINIPAGSLDLGTDTLTVNYTPDTTSSTIYNSSSGTNSVTVTTAVNPSFTITGSSLTIARGANTGNTSTISVTPLGGFTGSVALTAALTSSPAGAQYPPTFTFGSTSPVSISGTTVGTATLTISTTAASSAAAAYPNRPGSPWYVAGGTALACILLFGIPARRRRWQTMLGRALLLAALTGGLIACGGGGGGSGGGGTSNRGTTAGTYIITVTGASGSTTVTGTVNLTVE
jgi:uncharacterized repeat protein (TIGR03803 family)